MHKGTPAVLVVIWQYCEPETMVQYDGAAGGGAGGEGGAGGIGGDGEESATPQMVNPEYVML